MSEDEIDKLLNEYETALKRAGSAIKPFPLLSLHPNPDQIRNHALSMIAQIREMTAQPDSRDDLMKRLGFLQCAVWVLGYFTLSTLKDQRRSPPNPLQVDDNS